jgi:target of EGR1 protein 1
VILDELEKGEKRPEKKIKTSNEKVETIPAKAILQPPATLANNLPKTATDLFSQDHSASFDAYMTAYVHCYQSCTNQNADSKNRLYLIGKDIPLMVEKSKYSKCSKHHSEKKIN